MITGKEVYSDGRMPKTPKEIYEDTLAQALKIREKIEDSARKVYADIMDQEWKKYVEIKVQALKVREEAEG